MFNDLPGDTKIVGVDWGMAPEPDTMDATNSIVSVLKSIEYQQQETNKLLTQIMEKKSRIW